MLVFQPLKSGGREVVLERRPRWLRPRSSEWPLFSHLPICHGISCTCQVLVNAVTGLVERRAKQRRRECFAVILVHRDLHSSCRRAWRGRTAELNQAG